ncbi:hypothetical protein GH146_02550 [archaeon]|nr:hypothetical protein [archaeon]
MMGKRVTVFGTAWYQLNHSSYKVGSKRFHIATWFGCCSYRKLKVTVEMRKDVCPVCQHDLVKLRYFGSKRLSLSKERDSFEDLVEDGRVVFVEKVSRWAGARKNLIKDSDYFRFPDNLGLRSKRRFESAMAKVRLIDRVMPDSEVWHGGLPKKQL